MDIKPVKRNKEIVRFSKDHHFSLLFCWKIKQGAKLGVPAERMIKYVQYFRQYHLQPHFFEEETILFSPVNDAWVQRALDEHQQIQHQSEVVEKSTGKDAVNELLHLAKLVEEHIRYEERELFPHLEKVLAHEQLVEIGKKTDALPSPLPDDFEDSFWIK